MEPTETVYVDSTVVACDGSGGALGHPRVYLHLDTVGQVDCPYCSRRYILKDGARTGAGH